MRVLVKMIDMFIIRQGRTVFDAVNFVAPAKKKLDKICTTLAGYAGD